MRIVSNEEMRQTDQNAIEKIGLPSVVLMENAGLEAARLTSEFCTKHHHDGEVLVFCGKGKNGGDGLVLARRLLSSGHRVRVFLLHEPSEYSGESAINLKILNNQRARISVIESAGFLEEYFKSASPPHIAVDALLGTGLTRDLGGIYYDVVELLNRYATEIISLDIPTGISGDSGAMFGTAIQASVTISFGYPKVGHFLTPGAARRGRLFHVDLCFPRDWSEEGTKILLTKENIAPLLQDRDRFGHKNSFGHCLLVGGSPGRVGAIDMASKSALKMGTGLVTVASWEDSFPSLETKLSSEIMNFRIVREGSKFYVPKPGMSQFSSVVVGPGLGQRDDGAELLRQLIQEYSGPIVIDADGLNLVSTHNLHELLARRSFPTVLTPHPGEMSRLLGKEKDQIVRNPVDAVREAVERTGAIVVLKGATSLIHSADGVTWFNHYPNDGMATAGSGDVLAGMVGGLLGQKMTPLEATRLGVFIHSLSGRVAAEKNGHRSMTALDIIENVRDAFRQVREYRPSMVTQACVELD